MKNAASLDAATVGIDFGTTHLSAAITTHDWEQVKRNRSQGKRLAETNDPQGKRLEVPLGAQNEGSGLVRKWRYPVHVVLSAHGPEALGFDDVEDPENTSFGLKQAMLSPLYEKSDGEGAKFLQLCRKYAPLGLAESEEHGPAALLDASYVLHFKFVWGKIQKFASEHRLAITEIRIAMPAITYQGQEGKQVRDRIKRCAVEAGIPEETTIDVSEDECVMAYFLSSSSWEAISQNRARTVVLGDLGGGTADIMVLRVDRKGCTKQLCHSIGVTGGVADVEASFLKPCMGKSFTVYKDVKKWAHKLSDNSGDFDRDGVFIRADDLKDMFRKSCGPALDIIAETVRDDAQVDLVVVSSVAVSSNLFLQGLLKERLHQERPGLEVHIMDPEDAQKAVHLGASMPYIIPKSALELFKAKAFGTLEGEAGASDRANRLRILEVKKGRCSELEAIPETWEVFGDELCVRPHTFDFEKPGTGWTRHKPAVTEHKSADSFRPMLSSRYAVAMGTFVINVASSKKAEPSEKAECMPSTQWCWSKSESNPLLTLRVTRRDGAVVVVNMELVRTRYSIRLEHLSTSIQECPTEILSARDRAEGDQNGRTALPRQQRDATLTETEAQNDGPGRTLCEQSVDMQPANADLAALERHTNGTKREREASNDEESQPSLEPIILSSASPSPSNGRVEPFLRLGDGELATEVVLADFDRLADGKWLNDNLVNFYLVYLLLEFRRSNPTLKIHLYNSFFYEELSHGRDKRSAKKSRRDFEPLSFDYLVLPIHGVEHWYLALLCKPQRLVRSGQIAIRGRKASLRSAAAPSEPLIITLDSFGEQHPESCDVLRAYMKQHAGDMSELCDRLPASAATKIPMQNNVDDCGVYLLGYAAEFFKNPNRFVQSLWQNTNTDWSVNVAQVRHDIRTALEVVKEKGLPF